MIGIFNQREITTLYIYIPEVLKTLQPGICAYLVDFQHFLNSSDYTSRRTLIGT